jgi:P pilus assembly chaperone PapD
MERGATVLALIAALTQVGSAGTASAITVAPHALFIDHRTRSTVLYIQNSGDSPEEVSVQLKFGYPTSDSLGDVHVDLIDDPPPGEPSAAAWVRALPARAMVQPGARQAVRLLARPPAGLPDGEYWSRVIVTSRAQQPPVPAGNGGAVSVGLTLEMRTVISLIYRKGKVATGVALNSFGADARNDTLFADIKLARTGSAAYLGNLELVLRNAAGDPVDRWEQAIAVYRHLYRRLPLPVDRFKPGRYALDLRLSTERDDIATESVLPAPVVERTIELIVN